MAVQEELGGENWQFTSKWRKHIRDDEFAIGDLTGKQRYAASQLRQDWGDGTSTEQDAIQAVIGERVVSNATGLSWQPTVGVWGQKDVGGIIEVRSTVRRNGCLIVKPGDPKHPNRKRDSGPMVLVIVESERVYYMRGWMMAEDAFKDPRYPARSDRGDLAHFVEQKALHKMESLIEWIRGRWILGEMPVE